MEISANKDTGQTVYELAYLVLPSIAEEGLGKVVESLKGIIAREGGTEIAGEDPFKQELSYTMTKTIGASRYVVNDAYLGWIKFDLPAEASAKEGVEHPANKIKADVEKMDEIVRILLVKAPRETTFTFAEARKALEVEEAEEAEPADVEDSGEVKEAVVE
ncbi:MAG: 30S ribosomal protein S6 [Candidatus Zambryskibacteria bacterium]|nr:30S ribosomal protein S6 [Candidatus Zambryskibacteria bacterium]